MLRAQVFSKEAPSVTVDSKDFLPPVKAEGSKCIRVSGFRVARAGFWQRGAQRDG